MSRLIFALAILFAQIPSHVSSGETLTEALDINSNFSLKVSDPIPTEYVFTEGSNKPRFDLWGVAIFTAVDLDQDNCDDVILDWSDSLSPVQVFYGNKEGVLQKGEPFQTPVNVRSVRQFEFADLNQDNILDIVGFTAPHGWRQSELGNVWDDDEPEFIAVSQLAREYTVLANKFETYSHTGLLGDVDNDGTIDIIQITELPAEGTELDLNNNSAKKAAGGSMLKRSKYAVFDGETGDLNGDGLVDTVITLSKSYRKHRFVSPEDANKIGTVAVFFGQAGTKLKRIKPVILGSHWMEGELWDEFLSTKSANARQQAYAGTSNVELLDLDQDGDLDILIGYFVEANSHWMTSGVQIFENVSGKFVDATAKLMPFQPANMNLTSPTDLMYDASLADLNNDGSKDLVLALRSLDSMTDPRYSSVFYLFKDGKYVPVQNDENLLGDTQKMQLIQTGDFNCDGKQDLVGLFSGIPDKENHYLKTLLAQ